LVDYFLVTGFFSNLLLLFIIFIGETFLIHFIDKSLKNNLQKLNKLVRSFSANHIFRMKLVCVLIFTLFVFSLSQDIDSLTVRLLNSVLYNKYSGCEETTERLRESWAFLPPTVQETILKNTIKTLSQKVPSIPAKKFEPLVKNFVDLFGVPAKEACKLAYTTLSSKLPKDCLDKCIESSDLTFERMVRVLSKCSSTWKCYIEESGKATQQFGGCVSDCIEK
jgi:hypothetical protein